MSVETFVDKVKEGDINDAITTLKESIQAGVDSSIEEKRESILEGLGFVVEKEDDKKDKGKEDKDDDDDSDDEEKEDKDKKSKDDDKDYE